MENNLNDLIFPHKRKLLHYKYIQLQIFSPLPLWHVRLTIDSYHIAVQNTGSFKYRFYNKKKKNTPNRQSKFRGGGNTPLISYGGILLTYPPPYGAPAIYLSIFLCERCQLIDLAAHLTKKSIWVDSKAFDNKVHTLIQEFWAYTK